MNSRNIGVSDYINDPKQYTVPEGYGGRNWYPMPSQNQPTNVNVGQGEYPDLSSFYNPAVYNIAKKYGETIVDQGSQMVQQKVQDCMNVSRLKYYFCVDNSYVANKLLILLFPFVNKQWEVAFDECSQPVLPKDDVNAPDFYIPVMSIITYIITSGFVLGLRGIFTPEHLGILCSSALACLGVEILLLLLFFYISQVETSLKYTDFIAYSGYKFVNLSLLLLIGTCLPVFGYYITLLWFSITIGYFLVKTIRLRIQSPPSADMEFMIHLNKRRAYLLLLMAVIQSVVMWYLSWKTLFSMH